MIKFLAAIFILWCFLSLAYSQNVFINEIHYDNAGRDTLEAIEIAGPGNTNLNGWSIVLYNGSNGLAYRTISLNSKLSNDTNGFGFLYIDIPGIQNSAPEGVALIDSSNNVIQFISYEGSFTANDGPALGLTSNDIGISESSSTPVGRSLQLTGIGNSYNNFSWSGRFESSFGTINNGQTFGEPQPPASILINEIDTDTEGSDKLEFIEIFDGGSGNSYLNRFSVVLYNGSNNLIYAVYNLSGYNTDSNGYFVIGNALVENVDYVIPNGKIQNGADAIAIYYNKSLYINDSITTENLVDAVIYGTNDADDIELLTLLNTSGPQLNEITNNLNENLSLQRIPNGEGDLRSTSNYMALLPSPGADNIFSRTITKIHAIQGESGTSPLSGDSVIVEGIVIGDFQDPNQLNGFFMQEEDSDIDSNSLTSEGIFIDCTLDVSYGDKVQVTGTVKEQNGLTILTSVSEVHVTDSNSVIPSASIITLPLQTSDYLERFESMLVTTSQLLTITENYNLGRYGELLLSSGGRLINATNLFRPGIQADSVLLTNQLNQLLLDDGSTSQNPEPISYPATGLNANNTIRTGMKVNHIQGILSYGWSGSKGTEAYRAHPIEPPHFLEYYNPRSIKPNTVGGNLKVAHFNVFNYFTTINNGDENARGADSYIEFERQKAKITNAILAFDADIISLTELENNGYSNTSAIYNLVEHINSIATDSFQFIDPGVPKIGSNQVSVGILYKKNIVSPLGNPLILNASVDPLFNDEANRPSLLQAFVHNETNNKIGIVVNHFKSKGTNCNIFSDPDIHDGQGNCNQTRNNASIALTSWLATDPANIKNNQYLIIGDLNAYAKEDPIVTIESAGYVNLIKEFNANEYSYVFKGESGCLDYALATNELHQHVSGATVWHINADEPSILDYNTEYKSESQISTLYSDNIFRSSDHDPVLIGIQLEKVPLDSLYLSLHCSDNDNSLWSCEINNPNLKDIEVHWKINQPSQAGTHIAKPGLSSFPTKYSNSDTNLIIEYNLLDSVVVFDTLLSKSEPCNSFGFVSGNQFTKIDIDVFPQPFHNNVTIKFNDYQHVKNISIYNVPGRLVFRQNNPKTFKGMLEINTSGFEPGIYIIKVHTKKQEYSLIGIKK